MASIPVIPTVMLDGWSRWLGTAVDPSATTSGPLQGAALIGLIAAGGGLGMLLIVAVAWSRRRRAARRAGRAPGSTSVDPWREAARRLRTDPDDGSPWPPVDPRRQEP